MTILYIDCSSGVSGDMMLGAFLDLGVPERILTDGLACLGLNEFRLDIKRRQKDGVDCTDVEVVLLDEENARIHPYSGKYRNYGEIREIIDGSSLSETVKMASKCIFDIKAKAEARVHGVPVEDVQFHEAGAVDSIVDIVGTAICYDYLSVDQVVSCHVPTGYGTVTCACGELPVPAPAVKAILEETGIPHYRSDVRQELLTPTGASILAGIVDVWTDQKIPSFSRKGYGVGKRNTGLPPLTIAIWAPQQDG